MITRIDHVGVAVESLERGLRFWAEALGLEASGIETVEAEQVKVAFLPVGQSTVELLEPTGPGSPIAAHLEKRGAGIHHLTLEVRDLEAALQRLRERGVRTAGEAPRTGAGGRAVAFLHPRSTGGVLVELVAAGAARREPADIVPGSPVLAYLREPQEKLWGVLRRLDATGLVLHGIDLGSFDDWVGQIERDEESVIGPSVLFLPMSRVERILLDRSSGDLPSIAERFERRTGRPLRAVLGPDG